ncbi:hypothetical protein R6Q57_025940 [Mikania cordata]
MADTSSPPHSATSKPLRADAGKSPKKRKPTTVTSHAVFKRLHTDSSSNSEEIKDTASSKPADKEEEIEEVQISDDEVFQQLDEYEFRNGANPVLDEYNMQRFQFPYIHIGIGNEGGWESKIRHMKFKFKNDDRPIYGSCLTHATIAAVHFSVAFDRLSHDAIAAEAPLNPPDGPN